jgi:AcrR family transcriptional regulator
VSLNLVQYYFDSKAELLHAALHRLEEQSHQRWSKRLAALPRPPTVPAFIEAFLAEALPTDEASCAFHLVWTSYAVLAMTDADLAAQPFVAGPDRLERQLTGVLYQAQRDGGLDGQRDPAAEAARLLALSHRLGTSVLVGQRPAEAAMAILRTHLDQLFRHGSVPSASRPEAGATSGG